MKFVSDWMEYLRLNRSTAANLPATPDTNTRGQVYIDRTTQPDRMVYVRENVSLALEYAKLLTDLDINGSVQAYSALLTAIAALSGTGFITQTGAATVAERTFAVGTGLSIANPAGVAGNPTISLNALLAAIAVLAGNGIVVQTGAGTVANRSVAVGSGLSVANGDGVSGNPTVSLNTLLAAIAALSGTGLITQTGAGTVAERSVAAGSNISVTNGDGVSGNPTVAIVTSPDFSAVTVDGRFRSGGTTGTPTITKLTNSGTTSTITATAGADYHGEFTLNSSGTGQAAGAQVQIAFQNALPNAAYDLVIMERNANAVAAQPYVGTRAIGSVQINFANAPAAGQTYGLSYWVVEK